MFVNASFTVWVVSWRCSSTFSCACSARRRATSVDANVLPKSKRTCEPEIRATVLCVKVVTGVGIVVPVVVWPAKELRSHCPLQVPVICGSSGANA